MQQLYVMSSIESLQCNVITILNKEGKSVRGGETLEELQAKYGKEYGELKTYTPEEGNKLIDISQKKKYKYGILQKVSEERRMDLLETFAPHNRGKYNGVEHFQCPECTAGELYTRGLIHGNNHYFVTLEGNEEYTNSDKSIESIRKFIDEKIKQPVIA